MELDLCNYMVLTLSKLNMTKELDLDTDCTDMAALFRGRGSWCRLVLHAALVLHLRHGSDLPPHHHGNLAGQNHTYDSSWEGEEAGDVEGGPDKSGEVDQAELDRRQRAASLLSNQARCVGEDALTTCQHPDF
jgi:hypothetical protein